MKNIRLTEDTGKAWLTDLSLIPSNWKKYLTPKRFNVLESMVFGFPAKDCDSFNLTAKEFFQYAKTQGTVAVYLINEIKVNMQNTLDFLLKQNKSDREKKYHLVIKSLQDAIKNEEDLTFYANLHYKQYVEFYNENKIHYVKGGFNHFFTNFPNAKRY